VLVLVFVSWRIGSCVRRRGSKNISTSWYKQPGHAVKKAGVSRRVLSGVFFLSFVSGAGIIVLLSLGIFVIPWYIRLLSKLAFGVSGIMGLFDLVSFILLCRNEGDTRIVSAFGGFSLVHLVFVAVAICGELNLYNAAAADVVVFVGVSVGGLGRFVSLYLLWKNLFFARGKERDVDHAIEDQ
jgi:hypothetical protein